MAQTVYATIVAPSFYLTMKQRKKQDRRQARARSLSINLKQSRGSTIEETRFSHVLTRFLKQECVRGAQYSIADDKLFPHFRDFWKQTSQGFEHPALLGQFRVALAQRGIHATPGGKRPRWLGLTLRNRLHAKKKGNRLQRM